MLSEKKTGAEIEEEKWKGETRQIQTTEDSPLHHLRRTVPMVALSDAPGRVWTEGQEQEQGQREPEEQEEEEEE